MITFVMCCKSYTLCHLLGAKVMAKDIQEVLEKQLAYLTGEP